MKTSQFNKNTKVYLYGGQIKIKEQIRQSLLNEGYRNPIEISSTMLKKHDFDFSDSMAFICLADATKHERIAETLNDIGFEYILFLPTDGNYSIEIQRLYRKAYNDFFLGYFGELFIPYYEKKNGDCCGELIITQRNRHISFWCDKWFVKTPQTENLRREDAASAVLGEIPIVKLENRKIYVNLFRYFEGENVNIEDYLNFQCIDKKEWDEYLANRRNLIKLFNNNFNYNMSFFEDSPARAYWNDAECCFVINDGHHRIYFLRQKGFDKFPIIVLKSDFEKYRKCKNEK